MKKHRLLAIIALVLSMAPAFAQGESAPRRAVVNFSANYMRTSPDYESALETQALMGTVVRITDTSSYWCRIVSPDYEAWTTNLGLTEMTEEGIEAYEAAPKYMTTARYSAVYASPSRTSAQLSDLVRGDVLRKGEGRARKGFAPVILPDGRSGWTRKKDVMDMVSWQNSRKPSAKEIVAEARSYAGIPYLWGGTSVKGFDCSGLIQFCYRMNGLILPRNASQQVGCGTPVDVSHVLEGETGNLHEGDLLFFGNRETGKVTHVGMYIGNGHMIHSSHLVRINSIVPGEKDCYENIGRLLYGRRIL